jgi:EmrB/QacA subfamily drug resistance transporter
MAMVFTVISAIFPPAKRGKVQGVFGGVFGLSSIVGPLLGGYLTDNLSWRWVFYVNLPVGLGALAVLWFAFPNLRPRRTERPIDFLGAATLVAGVVPFLLALSWGGSEYPWASGQIVGLLLFAALMLIVFGLVEARAAEPIIPLGLFRNRIIAVATLALTLVATGMFGTILFVPLFIQGVIGTNATQSGTVLMPMMGTMVVASIVSGQVISRTGRYRLVGLFGLTTTALGMFLLSRMGTDTDYPTVVRNMVIVGLGLGPTMPVFTLAAQNAASLGQLGVVTSLTQFARSIGGTLGAAIFGSLLANRFGPALREALPAQIAASIPPERLAEFQNPRALLNPQASDGMREGLAQFGPQGAQAFEALLGAIRVALATSLHEMFLVGSVIVAVGAVVVLFLKEIPLKKSYGRGPAPAVPAGAVERRLGEDAVPSLPPVQPRDQPVLARRR